MFCTQQHQSIDKLEVHYSEFLSVPPITSQTYQCTQIPVMSNLALFSRVYVLVSTEADMSCKFIWLLFFLITVLLFFFFSVDIIDNWNTDVFKVMVSPLSDLSAAVVDASILCGFYRFLICSWKTVTVASHPRSWQSYNFHRHFRWLYIQQQSSSSSSNRFIEQIK